MRARVRVRVRPEGTSARRRPRRRSRPAPCRSSRTTWRASAPRRSRRTPCHSALPPRCERSGSVGRSSSRSTWSSSMGTSSFVVRRAFRASSSGALKPTLDFVLSTSGSLPLGRLLEELFIEDFWWEGCGGGASAAGVSLGSGAPGASALLPAQPMAPPRRVNCLSTRVPLAPRARSRSRGAAQRGVITS